MSRYVQRFALSGMMSLVMMGPGGSLLAAEDPGAITAARQESQITTTYTLNEHLEGDQIQVAVDNGVVVLTGTVSDEVSRELAGEIARGVEGIDDVDNRIEVDPEHVADSGAVAERGYGDVVRDATITASVKSRLLWSRHAEGLSTNVEVDSGRVTLLGTATSEEAREVAGSLASSTEGVESVDNRIVVDETAETIAETATGAAADLRQSFSDTWITTRVKSSLMYSRSIRGSAISVSTQDGVVTLSGNVETDAERALAIEIAGNIRGVSGVEAEELVLP